MNTLYKSWSYYVYMWKYTPLILIAFGISAYLFSNIKLFPIFVFCMACLSTFFIFKSKNVEFNEESLIIKGFNSIEEVDYKNIIWINQQIGSISPHLFCMHVYVSPLIIKYKNIHTNKNIIVFTVFKMETSHVIWNTFKESELTKDIRSLIISKNPEYLISNEPSRWINTIIVGLIFLVLLISNIP